MVEGPLHSPGGRRWRPSPSVGTGSAGNADAPATSSGLPPLSPAGRGSQDDQPRR
jgi:hypothetical protein